MLTKKYILIFFSMWMMIVITATLFTLIIDPFGISPIRIPIKGINIYKPERENKDRLVKKFDILRQKPKTLLLGTSRVKQALNPEKFAGTEFYPAYNAALDNCSIIEQYQLLEYSILVNKNLKYVFVELFPMHGEIFGYPSENALSQIEASFELRRPLSKDMIYDAFSSFMTYSAIKGVFKTIIFNIKNLALLSTTQNQAFDTGFHPCVDKEENAFSVMNAPNFIASTLKMGMEFKRLEHIMYLKKIISLCEKHHIDCKFFISPMHSQTIYAFYWINWPALLEFKRTTANLAPTYDFSILNEYTDEIPRNPMIYWPELNHFSSKLGDKMISDFTGKVPKHSVLLSPENIEKELDRQTVAIKQWNKSTLFKRNLEFAEYNISVKKKNDANFNKNNLTLQNEKYSIDGECKIALSSLYIDKTYYYGNIAGCKDFAKIDSILFFVNEHEYYRIKPNINYIMQNNKITRYDIPCTFFYGIKDLIPENKKIKVFAIKNDMTALELTQ